MRREIGSQASEVRSQHTETQIPNSSLGRLKPSAAYALLLLTSAFWLLTPSFAATHVTASYDLGPSPKVMATVGGTPQYGLVFAQRNKSVSYNGIQYGATRLQGYLDAAGQLNDGEGNAWLDLIPNSTATPADSYYVVTLNIQGQVHSEIWVVPDVPTVSAGLCRQAQAPSPTGPALFYQFIQKDGAALRQRSALNFSGAGVTCSDNAAQLRTDCALAGGSGSAPLASATASGTVKTDTTEADPVVYLKSTADSLLAAKANSAHSHAESDVANLISDLSGKVSTTRTVATSAPLSGGGTLASDLTLSCPGCEITTNKDAAGGYAGLTASSKITASQVQKVISSGDLTDFGDKSGSGTTMLGSTITSPSSNQCLIYSNGNWVNGSCAGGGSNHNLLAATHPDTVAASPTLGDLLYANSTPAWTRLSGNTGATKKFLTQTGTGSVSAAPAWGTIAAGDLPTHTHTEGDVSNLSTDLGAKADKVSITGATKTKITYNPQGIVTGGVDATAADVGAVPATRNVSTSSPLGGGGALNADLTLVCSTCEVTGNKNATNGYAGLSSGKIAASQIQEVISSGDLTDFGNKSGSGTTIIGATITTPASNDVLTWNGSNWINQAPSGGGSHAMLSAAHSDTTAGTVARGDLITGQGATPSWTRLAKGAAGKCLQMDGTGTDIVWDNCAAGGGDNISVGGAAATDANFSDTAPAALEGVNVKWQKDTTAPDNISAYVPPAGAAATGVVTTTTQMLAGDKTFSGATSISGGSGNRLVVDTNSLVVDGSDHRVGIGVANPTSPLDVTYSGVDGIVPLFIHTAGSSISNSPAFVVNLPSAGMRKGFQLSNGTDAYAWASFEFNAGKPGLLLGPGGAGARDVNIYRDAADSLKTDDAFTAGVSATSPVINATTGFQVNGAASTGAALVGNGTNFVTGTIGSAGLAAANKTVERSINLLVPATGDSNRIQIYYGQNVTITRIACSTDTGTVDINFDERAEGTPNTAGTNVMSSNLQCTTSTATQTSFANAGIAADVPLNLQIASVASSPNVARIHVKATID